MPEKMLITIDGWHDTPKALVGNWVADGLGGLLVNSEQILRALIAACAKSGVDVNDYGRVESWCEQSGVDIGFAQDGCRTSEAHVAVNGHWFTKSELENVAELVANRAAYDTFGDKVRQVLRRCDFDDRVIIVGSDVGYEFPKSPYKYFLDNTSGTRNPVEWAGLAYPWMGHIRNYKGPDVTYFERAVNTLMIDASRAAPADVVVVILVESVARACEMGFVGARPETALADAYFVADATRQRMKVALAQSSK
jgi:cytidylate kinase